VGEGIAGPDRQRRVWPPLVRITDLGMERRQLLQRELARRRRHPRQDLNARAIGGAQVLDQLEHLLLRGWRKVALHVQLAGRLAQPQVDGADGALPARLLLLLAVQGAAVEVDPSATEALRRHGGVLDQLVMVEVVPPALTGTLPNSAASAC